MAVLTYIHTNAHLLANCQLILPVCFYFVFRFVFILHSSLGYQKCNTYPVKQQIQAESISSNHYHSIIGCGSAQLRRLIIEVIHGLHKTPIYLVISNLDTNFAALNSIALDIYIFIDNKKKKKTNQKLCCDFQYIA